jgi:hypothetical protein
MTWSSPLLTDGFHYGGDSTRGSVAYWATDPLVPSHLLNHHHSAYPVENASQQQGVLYQDPTLLPLGYPAAHLPMQNPGATLSVGMRQVPLHENPYSLVGVGPPPRSVHPPYNSYCGASHVSVVEPIDVADTSLTRGQSELAAPRFFGDPSLAALPFTEASANADLPDLSGSSNQSLQPGSFFGHGQGQDNQSNSAQMGLLLYDLITSQKNIFALHESLLYAEKPSFGPSYPEGHPLLLRWNWIQIPCEQLDNSLEAILNSFDQVLQNMEARELRSNEVKDLKPRVKSVLLRYHNTVRLQWRPNSVCDAFKDQWREKLRQCPQPFLGNLESKWDLERLKKQKAKYALGLLCQYLTFFGQLVMKPGCTDIQLERFSSPLKSAVEVMNMIFVEIDGLQHWKPDSP